MTQLTGLSCAICDERISSVLDGEFCPTCGCPVHTRCATPEAAHGCGACGADAAAAAAHRERVEEAARVHASMLCSHHMGRGLLMLVAGVALLAGGVVSILVSIAAVSNEGGIVVLWYGAILVGAGLVLRGIGHFVAACRIDPSDR